MRCLQDLRESWPNPIVLRCYHPSGPTAKYLFRKYQFDCVCYSYSWKNNWASEPVRLVYKTEIAPWVCLSLKVIRSSVLEAMPLGEDRLCALLSSGWREVFLLSHFVVVSGAACSAVRKDPVLIGRGTGSHLLLRRVHDHSPWVVVFEVCGLSWHLLSGGVVMCFKKIIIFLSIITFCSP